MIVAIHQPNFVPWVPFFRKVQAADLFVILSHCQYCRTAYQNRFRYKDKWHSMSVSNSHSQSETIREKNYREPRNDWAFIRRKLNHPLLAELEQHIHTSLLETNVAIIQHLMKRLGITTPVAFDYPTELAATERLADICRHYGATKYLSGRSGGDYMDLGVFERLGIGVEFQQVKPEDEKHVLDVL